MAAHPHWRPLKNRAVGEEVFDTSSAAERYAEEQKLAGHKTRRTRFVAGLDKQRCRVYRWRVSVYEGTA